MNIWYTLNQIHVDKPYFAKSDGNQPDVANQIQPHSGTLWHFIDNVKDFVTNFLLSSIWKYFSNNTGLLFNGM